MASAITGLKIEAIISQFAFVCKQAIQDIWRIEKMKRVD